MIEAIVGIIGVGLFGVLGWAFTLNSRVSVLEADKVNLRELLNTKLDNISNRLARIERKLDREESLD